MDVYDISDQLHDITAELAIVIAAIDGMCVRGPEGYGLYLVLTRHIERLNALKDNICQPAAAQALSASLSPSS